MALFKRKKTDSVLPEVDKYYEGERRERAGLAWLLALISIIIVAFIIIGVFLAGRWVYRQVTKDDNANETATSDVEVPSFDGSTDSQNSDEKSEEEKRAEAEAKAEEDQQGRVDAPARTDVPSVPATGDNAPLPNTGPANLIGVFAGVTTLAGGIHYIVERRRTR